MGIEHLGQKRDGLGLGFRLALAGYSLLMTLLQPLLLFKLKRRGRQEPGYLQSIDERFGHYPPGLERPPGVTVWVHAVSLGETRAVAPLLSALRARWPGLRVLLTHGTATGRNEGKKLLQAGDSQVWQPWDTPRAVGRFLHHFKPDLGILMETEVWPNLVMGCQKAGVPLVLANARMSERSQRRAARLRFLSQPVFGAFAAVYAQSEADADRLIALGAPAASTMVMGNLKHDAQPSPVLLEKGRQWRRRCDRPVVMLASSREGEELLWLQALGSMSELARSVQWLVVPRHPQRFDVVADLLSANGVSVLRRSSWGEAGPPALNGGVVIVGDSLGEMAAYYGMADLCLLGGSFEPLGGQNLIEAAACSCPVVLGPHTFNFAQASEQAAGCGAAWRVKDISQALALVDQLSQDDAALEKARESCAALSQQHRGAVDKTVTAVAEFLSGASS